MNKEEKSGQSRDILLVENEQESVEIRLKWLREGGYNPFPLPTLSGAWQYIIDYKEDHSDKLPLVLLDIMMPTIGDLDWLTDYEKANTKIRSLSSSGIEMTPSFLMDRRISLVT